MLQQHPRYVAKRRQIRRQPLWKHSCRNSSNNSNTSKSNSWSNYTRRTALTMWTVWRQLHMPLAYPVQPATRNVGLGCAVVPLAFTMLDANRSLASSRVSFASIWRTSTFANCLSIWCAGGRCQQRPPPVCMPVPKRRAHRQLPQLPLPVIIM